METPNWRQILGGTAGVALLGAVGYFGQARVRTDSSPQKFVSSQTKAAKTSPDSKPAPANKPESNSGPEESDFNMPPPAKVIKVDITGEIMKPGVYELAEGLRVEDLIKLAGGLKGNADRNGINFAMKLNDEAKIVVPSKAGPATRSAVTYPKNVVKTPKAESFDSNSESYPSFVPKTKKNSPSMRKQPPAVPVSINSATEIELQTVPGIGPAMAKRISDFRATNGGFSKIEDLRKVKGMGGKTFDKIRQWIRL